MRIVDCQVCHVASPLGYQMERPVFSYTVIGAAGKRQAAARIRVSLHADLSDPILDTGFSANIDSLAFPADIALAPRTRYYWDVSVQSDAGEEATSDINWFETAKMDEEWAAQWITCAEGDGRHPVFFRSVPVGQPVQSARLYICGLGVYEAYWNGEKIGDEYLTPYCNNYQQWLQYQTYDVTEQLQASGELSVLLGNGWYKGRFGFENSVGQPGHYGNSWNLIAELRVTFADGSEMVLGTDESWQVRRSGITASSIYDGEAFDATLAETAPEAVSPSTEKLAPLVARLSLPVLVHEEISPVALLRTPAGETVLDLGQNFAGSFRLRVNEPKGTVIHLQFGEILQGGNFYRDNLRSALAEYIYISDGRERVLQPHFTFYGYRFVKIEGMANLRAEDFTGLALYSALPRAGSMTTGSALVNQLISNTEWGLKGNFLDVPTDCPQRDERMGWTGDAQVFSPTACFLRDSYAFFRKYLHDMETEQREHGGQVPIVIPSFHQTRTSTVWSDAACIIPWTLYMFYGDLSILADQYQSMKDWVDALRRIDGDNHAWRDSFHYGDWLALDNPAGGSDQVWGGTDVGLIADVYYAYSAELVAKAARLLGKEDDAAQYEALCAKVRQGLRDEFYSATGRCCIDTQTALLLTLRHNLSDDREKTRAALLRKFKESGGKLKTGFVGTPILCNQLSEEGFDDLAYSLLLNEEYPGWLYSVKLGATTIWERWNSVLPDGSISSTGMNSLNHYAYGSIVEWLYRHAMGINPIEDAPGFRRARIAPKPSYKLGHLEAEYPSAAGTYKVAWKVIGDKGLELSITVPFDCEAELVLPYAPDALFADHANPMFADVRDGVCYLPAGEYKVSYEATKPLRNTLSVHMSVDELLRHDAARALVEEAFPSIGNMPSTLRSMSIVQLLAAYKQGDAGQVEALDVKLGQIER